MDGWMTSPADRGSGIKKNNLIFESFKMDKEERIEMIYTYIGLLGRSDDLNSLFNCITSLDSSGKYCLVKKKTCQVLTVKHDTERRKNY